MRKARLLFIIDGFGAGGAEIQLLEVLKCLPRETFESAVVSLADSGPLKKDYINLGIEIHALARKNRFDISMMIHLYRFIRTGRFDVVIPILFYPDILGTFVSKIAGVRKVISWAHASHCNALFNPRYRRILYKSVMRYADCVIAVSEDMKNSIIDNNQFLSGRMRVVPNGVDLPRFNEKAVTAVSGKKRRSGVTIGVVGRLERVKGHTYLIQALNLIKDGFPRLKCLFFGDGRERETLERQVREEHLDTVVEFRGYREDIPAVMRQLDVFVLPSISEGLPNVILEAMASSLPGPERYACSPG